MDLGKAGSPWQKDISPGPEQQLKELRVFGLGRRKPEVE